MTDSPSTRTVDRALALLAAVCHSEAPSLTECARQTGLPASTALRLLRTLENADFVSRDADGSYRAGTNLVQLGARALSRQRVVETCRPAMDRIVAATGESTYLCIHGPGGTALYVAMIEGTFSIRHTSWAGRTGPLADSAVGTVLTGRTPAAGYVAMRSVIEPDVTAIAAPVLHPGGVVAAISLVGPAYRLDDTTTDRFGRLLADEAARTSGVLGVEAKR